MNVLRSGILGGVLSMALALLVGCSAPHDSPFDPESDYYRGPLPPLPQIDGSVRSLHISRNWPGTDTYTVVAELAGTGATDLDSAWVTYDARNTVALARIDGIWRTLFSSSYFGDPRLGSVIGQPFFFTALARDGNTYSIGPAYLFRVIETVPQLTEPVGGDTVGAVPILTWPSFAGGFPFGYMANVVNITEGFETTVWTSPVFPSTVLSTSVPDSLPDGEYFWTIAVVDSFENSSRSKEGAFVVRSSNGG